MLQVSRKMIIRKAKSMFDKKNDDSATRDSFVAAVGVKRLCEDMGAL